LVVLPQLKTFECRLGMRLGWPKISLELTENLKFLGMTGIEWLQATPSSATWLIDVWVNKTGNVLLRDSETRLCKNCCGVKVISVIYSECVFVALGIQHVKRIRHTVICGLSASTLVFYNISYKDFRKQGIECKMHVLFFSIHFVRDAFCYKNWEAHDRKCILLFMLFYSFFLTLSQLMLHICSMSKSSVIGTRKQTKRKIQIN
jgi:hypothetical protein